MKSKICISSDEIRKKFKEIKKLKKIVLNTSFRAADTTFYPVTYHLPRPDFHLVSEDGIRCPFQLHVDSSHCLARHLGARPTWLCKRNRKERLHCSRRNRSRPKIDSLPWSQIHILNAVTSMWYRVPVWVIVIWV